ncbi:MAG: diaminopimelate epimerase [Candidatus Omnitrophica bacterium]|nr:diaminopimelate epimerase [Candidatus Omnitrophota bacterium]
MTTIPFYKMQASGNDFIVIDHREPFIPDVKAFAKKVCVRQFSVGADGVLLVEKSSQADFKMRIINADGSEAEMCGNGSRCVVLFARDVLNLRVPLTMETLGGLVSGDIQDGWIKVKLVEPKNYRAAIALGISGSKKIVSFVDTMVPHVVHFTDHLNEFPVREVGRAIRNHKEFAPRGTNVNFVQVLGPNQISVRTYERGVEDETLACGTGVTASSVVSAIEHQVKSPVHVTTRGGEVIKVYFDLVDGRPTNVHLEGQAHFSFKGELNV